MAKRKKKPKPAVPVATRRKRRRTTITKITRESREVRQNPAGAPRLSDLTQVILPGFGAFAATKVIQRVIYSLVQKRWPKLGKHAHALSGIAAFGGLWYFAHKIRALAKYHDGILIGSGIAAGHGIAQCYLPQKYNWLLADCKPSDVAPIAPAPNSNGTGQIAAPTTSDGDEFSYLESQLDEMEQSGDRRTRHAKGSRGNGRPVAQAMKQANSNNDAGFLLDPDLVEELGNEAVDDLYTGAFSTN